MLTVGSSGFPTPERKPTPVRASAFQGCSNYFEPLKRHLAVGWANKNQSPTNWKGKLQIYGFA